MNEKHIVSLELSKKLKEVGYPQEGEFWWVKHKKLEEWCLSDTPNRENNEFFDSSNFIRVIAPLASELMERLPLSIGYIPPDIDPGYGLVIQPVADRVYVYYFNGKKEYCRVYDTNLCNALAKMYIYLAENKLLASRREGEVG